MFWKSWFLIFSASGLEGPLRIFTNWCCFKAFLLSRFVLPLHTPLTKWVSCCWQALTHTSVLHNIMRAFITPTGSFMVGKKLAGRRKKKEKAKNPQRNLSRSHSLDCRYSLVDKSEGLAVKAWGPASDSQNLQKNLWWCNSRAEELVDLRLSSLT